MHEQNEANPLIVFVVLELARFVRVVHTWMRNLLRVLDPKGIVQLDVQTNQSKVISTQNTYLHANFLAEGPSDTVRSFDPTISVYDRLINSILAQTINRLADVLFGSYYYTKGHQYDDCQRVV